VGAKRDHDAAVADSSTMAVRVGQFRGHHGTLLEACGGVIDVLSPARVSIVECLDNVPRWCLPK